MKPKISALMDSETSRRDTRQAMDALKNEDLARDTWHVYHLISDSMRETRLLSEKFSAGIAERLANESSHSARWLVVWRWRALSVAASLAAIVFVVAVAWPPQQGSFIVPLQTAPQEEVAQVPPPAGADDYLLAHQGYSPRNSLQGIAPYVRTIAGEASEDKP